MSRKPPPSQQEFLRSARQQLNLDWDSLAVHAGITPRALKSYRLPDTSGGHRAMPAIARHAIESLLESPRAPLPPPQQKFLEHAMATLGCTMAELAIRIDVSERAMKNWRRPDSSSSHRGMPSLARAAIEKLLRKSAQEKA